MLKIFGKPSESRVKELELETDELKSKNKRYENEIYELNQELNDVTIFY